MNYELLLELLIKLVIVPLIVYAIKVAEGYVKRLVKIKQVESILLQATEAVEAAVGEVSQTFVNTLKEKEQFTKANAQLALDMARKRALDILTPSAQQILERSVGDIGAYITAKIEAEVLKQKGK